MKSRLANPIVGPVLAIAALLIIAGATTPMFFESSNLSNLILQMCVVSIVAIGATVVILTGGIDLSPGSMIGLLTMLLALLVKNQNVPLALALPAVLGAGVLLGAVNGFVTAYVRIPSFVATLAALSILGGLAFMLTDGTPIFSVSSGLSDIFYGDLLDIPLPFFYVAICYGAAWLLLNHMPRGREIYAVGGNPVAARLSGIDDRFIQFFVFALAGLTYAIAAILFAARLNSGSPNHGTGMELQAIAATVIGGVSLTGGRGNILGTLLGALLITVVQNVMNLHGIAPAPQAVMVGLIILVAVAIDMWRFDLGHALARLWRSRSEPAQRSSWR
jgi:ribose transport system permease protein